MSENAKSVCYIENNNRNL